MIGSTSFVNVGRAAATVRRALREGGCLDEVRPAQKSSVRGKTRGNEAGKTRNGDHEASLAAYSSTHEAPYRRCASRRFSCSWSPAAAHLRAQQNQPIYPAYDGFLKNPDGSYTLAFAYFSHNADEVTIDARPSNGFAPTPGDRMQPTTFKPGHWRFQCVMVVGPEFDGKMKWTLTYAGVTTGTSERMLQSNWNLVEGAPALSKIEYAKVPKGVCLNQPPTVRVLGVTARPNNPPTLIGRGERRTEPVRQRARRRPAARQGPRGRVEDVEWARHRDIHDSRVGANEGSLLGAGALRTRVERLGLRVHAAHSA